MLEIRCERCNKIAMSAPLTEVTLTENQKRQICEECVTSLRAWWYSGQLHSRAG
jgi:hypothetical protein